MLCSLVLIVKVRVVRCQRCQNGQMSHHFDAFSSLCVASVNCVVCQPVRSAFHQCHMGNLGPRREGYHVGSRLCLWSMRLMTSHSSSSLFQSSQSSMFEQYLSSSCRSSMLSSTRTPRTRAPPLSWS